MDVDTQRDFFLADGHACIRNHRRVLSNIRRMMAWARRNHIEVISTCEVHSNSNGTHNDDDIFCVDGTFGVEKISYTLLPDRACFTADGNSELPGDVLRRYKQVILDKRCENPFEEPRIERLLSEVNAAEFVVIGATAERAVAATVLGLLQRNKRVTVVTDAIGAHNTEEAKIAIRKMCAKGAKLIETKKLAGASHLQRVNACQCRMCAN